MSRYDFSLRQEVLLEKGAAVPGDLFQYKRQQQIAEDTHPISVMYSLVWAAKQDILTAETEAALEQIEGQFDLANRFLAGDAASLTGMIIADTTLTAVNSTRSSALIPFG